MCLVGSSLNYPIPPEMWVWALLGTLLCFLGFLRKPRESFEYLAPRFVVPLLIWIASVGDFLYYALNNQAYQYESMIVGNGSVALAFMVCCLAGFWLGFWLPIGKWIARMLTPLHGDLLLAEKLPLQVAVGCTLLLTLLVVAVSGGAFIDARVFSGRSLLAPNMAVRFLPVMGLMLMTVGALCVGLAWPRKGPWSMQLFLLFLLILLASPNMAKFSRGSGLSFMIAAVGYSMRHRRLNPLGLTLGGLACVFGAHAGLGGRSIYGHYAGVIPFLTYAITDVFDGLLDSLTVVFSAVGKFTVTSVVVGSADDAAIRSSPWWKWIWFQFPIPRLLGLGPGDVGLSVKHVIGGVGSRGYTPSMFGDAWGHMRWMGLFAFSFVGICYRAIEALAFRPLVYSPKALNLSIFLIPPSYMALMLGFHNTYRGWIVAFFYPGYMIFALAVLIQLTQGRSWFLKVNPSLIR